MGGKSGQGIEERNQDIARTSHDVLIQWRRVRPPQGLQRGMLQIT